MNPINSSVLSGVNPAASSTAATSSKAVPRSDTSSNDVQLAAADTVRLSGHALMLSRLFGQDESTYTGAVLTQDGDTPTLSDFLTKDDRDMLEKMYEYSQNNGLDLRHVDALGGDLGFYRRFGASQENKNLYDTEGHKLTPKLSEANQQISDRIDASDAISQSTIDQGFLRSEMVVGGHAANYSFLERIIGAFSTTDPLSSDKLSQENRAPIAAYNAEANKLLAMPSKDVQLVIPEADYMSVNGVGRWRTPELAAANGAKQSDGLSVKLKTMQDMLSILDSYARENNSASPDMTGRSLIGRLITHDKIK
jgi:hypothetical protein